MFNSTTLLAGLSIVLSGGVNENWTLIPNLYDETTIPRTFDTHWDGQNLASNGLGNAVGAPVNPAGRVANLITFNYALGAASFGIGLSNFQSKTTTPASDVITNHTLFVNGFNMGTLETLAEDHRSVKRRTWLAKGSGR